jgi:hypothetical protein
MGLGADGLIVGGLSDYLMSLGKDLHECLTQHQERRLELILALYLVQCIHITLDP